MSEAKIQDLTAQKARNRARKSLGPVDDALANILRMIKDAADEGQNSVRIPSGYKPLKEALKARKFTVKDTGMVWHISW